MGVDFPLTRVSAVLKKEDKGLIGKYIGLFENLVDIVAYVEYRVPRAERDGRNIKYNFACSQLWQRMFIAWDGDVTVCCVDSEREYLVGNIKNDTLKNIWTNEKYSNIRSNHQAGKYYNIGICKKCELPSRSDDGSI